MAKSHDNSINNEDTYDALRDKGEKAPPFEEWIKDELILALRT